MQGLDITLAHTTTATTAKTKNVSINQTGVIQCGGIARYGKMVIDMRLIDADAIPWTDLNDDPNSKIRVLITFADKVNKMPTIEPERKKGKWIYKNDLKQFFCSECGYPSLTYDDTYIYGMDLPNYCEDCGADMRGGQDE